MTQAVLAVSLIRELGDLGDLGSKLLLTITNNQRPL